VIADRLTAPIDKLRDAAARPDVREAERRQQ
jgi:hypothetical protein